MDASAVRFVQVDYGRTGVVQGKTRFSVARGWTLFDRVARAMIFEIWSFTDRYGGTWHLESVDGPEAQYDGFLRHVEHERQTMRATMAYRFDAETRQDAEAFYRAWLHEKGLDGLPHPEDEENE